MPMLSPSSSSQMVRVWRPSMSMAIFLRPFLYLCRPTGERKSRTSAPLPKGRDERHRGGRGTYLGAGDHVDERVALALLRRALVDAGKPFRHLALLPGARAGAPRLDLLGRIAGRHLLARALQACIDEIGRHIGDCRIFLRMGKDDRGAMLARQGHEG